MKITTEFFSKLLIIVFITTILCIQQLTSMEYTSAIEEVQNTPVTGDNPDFHLYMLLSSTAYNSPFWLPADIIRCITNNAHNITQLLLHIKVDCSRPDNLLGTAYRLNYLYPSCPNMPVALLKIYLNDHKTSLLDIKDAFGRTTFDNPYANGFGLEPEIEMLCQLVDKKAFVDHFKEPFDQFYVDIGCIIKTKKLHCLICHNHNPQVIQLYCGVFMDYAQNCAKKSKEVLHLLKAKDSYGETVLDITKYSDDIEIAAIFKNTKKVLRRTILEKKICLIQ